MGIKPRVNQTSFDQFCAFLEKNQRKIAERAARLLNIEDPYNAWEPEEIYGVIMDDGKLVVRFEKYYSGGVEEGSVEVDPKVLDYTNHAFDMYVNHRQAEETKRRQNMASETADKRRKQLEESIAELQKQLDQLK